MTDDAIRVLIVDDHPMFRDGLRSLLESTAGFDVTGEAATGAEAVDLAAELQPDIVVMDLNMPGMNGVEATRAISDAAPRSAVLVLTMLENDDSVFATLRAGARGYILKSAAPVEITRAVQSVARGEAIFSPAVADRISAFFASAPRTPATTAFPQLTDREREVLGLIAAGRDNRRIARDLGIQPKTVRNHVSNVFTKLHVADRAQAIIQAREAGLGEL